jgi:TatA/E family protein of Tat protein translocase
MVGDILQPTHLLLILVVALLVLGPKRLPEVGRTLGSGLRDFRQAINGEANSHDDREPQAYVETEPEPAHVADGPDDMAEPAYVADEPDDIADPATASYDDAAEPAPVVAATATAEPAHDEEFTASGPTAQPAPSRAPAASGAGFASALAASRQRPSGDGEPADDE